MLENDDDPLPSLQLLCCIIGLIFSHHSPSFSAKGQFDMFEFYNRTGHDIRDMLLRCTYRGEVCNHTWFRVVSLVILDHRKFNGLLLLMKIFGNWLLC